MLDILRGSDFGDGGPYIITRLRSRILVPCVEDRGRCNVLPKGQKFWIEGLSPARVINFCSELQKERVRDDMPRIGGGSLADVGILW